MLTILCLYEQKLVESEFELDFLKPKMIKKLKLKLEVSSS